MSSNKRCIKYFHVLQLDRYRQNENYNNFFFNILFVNFFQEYPTCSVFWFNFGKRNRIEIVKFVLFFAYKITYLISRNIHTPISKINLLILQGNIIYSASLQVQLFVWLFDNLLYLSGKQASELHYKDGDLLHMLSTNLCRNYNFHHTTQLTIINNNTHTNIP